MAKDPEVEAQSVLDTVWRSVAPPGEPIPVDPIRIAHEMGITIFIGEMEPNQGGMIYKDPYKEPTIVLNQADHTNRIRFTCAHELGHYVNHPVDDWEKLSFTDYRDTLAGRGTDPEEVFANKFAAELLMPADEVSRRHTFTPSVVTLAYEFKVSAEAMRHRLDNLGLTAAG